MDISKEFSFEASHILPKHPGKCSRLHGHSWKLKVTVSGDVNPETGFVMDFSVLKSFVEAIICGLDHYHLGAATIAYGPPAAPHLLSNFYPTSENLIVWIAGELDKQTYLVEGIAAGRFPWSKLELNETCTSSCVLTREEYQRVKEYEKNTIRPGQRNMGKTQSGD